MKNLDHPTKLDWSRLPSSFHRIRLELARETRHRQGDAATCYSLIAPLDGDGRIDANLWYQYREFCRVVRFRPEEEDDVGHLVRKQGGGFAFRYDIRGDQEEETGYHF